MGWGHLTSLQGQNKTWLFLWLITEAGWISLASLAGASGMIYVSSAHPVETTPHLSSSANGLVLAPPKWLHARWGETRTAWQHSEEKRINLNTSCLVSPAAFMVLKLGCWEVFLAFILMRHLKI